MVATQCHILTSRLNKDGLGYADRPSSDGAKALIGISRISLQAQHVARIFALVDMFLTVAATLLAIRVSFGLAPSIEMSFAWTCLHSYVYMSKDDSIRQRQLTGLVKVSGELRKNQTFGLNNAKIWSVPLVADNIENIEARIGTLVNATSHILSGLQN